MTRSIDQISFDALTPGVRDNTRTCPTCSGVGVLTATDLFCGAGGSSLGLEKVRCPSCGRSLIEIKYALNHWDLAIQAHNANFPKADHAINGAGEVAPSIFGYTDLGWFSPECFPAGTLVCFREQDRVTYCPIEHLEVGTEVLTHEGRWRKIVRTQRKIGSTLRIADTHGHHIRATGNHKFWCKVGSLDAQPQDRDRERAGPADLLGAPRRRRPAPGRHRPRHRHRPRRLPLVSHRLHRPRPVRRARL
jgi:hypothetical protein